MIAWEELKNIIFRMSKTSDMQSAVIDLSSAVVLANNNALGQNGNYILGEALSCTESFRHDALAKVYEFVMSPNTQLTDETKNTLSSTLIQSLQSAAVYIDHKNRVDRARSTNPDNFAPPFEIKYDTKYLNSPQSDETRDFLETVSNISYDKQLIGAVAAKVVLALTKEGATKETVAKQIESSLDQYGAIRAEQIKADSCRVKIPITKNGQTFTFVPTQGEEITYKEFANRLKSFSEKNQLELNDGQIDYITRSIDQSNIKSAGTASLLGSMWSQSPHSQNGDVMLTARQEQTMLSVDISPAQQITLHAHVYLNKFDTNIGAAEIIGTSALSTDITNVREPARYGLGEHLRTEMAITLPKAIMETIPLSEQITTISTADKYLEKYAAIEVNKTSEIADLLNNAPQFIRPATVGAVAKSQNLSPEDSIKLAMESAKQPDGKLNPELAAKSIEAAAKAVDDPKIQAQMQKNPRRIVLAQAKEQGLELTPPKGLLERMQRVADQAANALQGSPLKGLEDKMKEAPVRGGAEGQAAPAPAPEQQKTAPEVPPQTQAPAPDAPQPQQQAQTAQPPKTLDTQNRAHQMANNMRQKFTAAALTAKTHVNAAVNKVRGKDTGQAR